MKKPEVSIIVITYNRAKVLRLCVESLLKQNYPPERYEIVIVDSNSTDGTAEMLKEYRGKVRKVNCPEKGYSTSRNFGVKNAKADIIAFTDSDCFPSKDWVRKIVENFRKDPKLYAVGGSTTVIFNRTIVARVSQEIVNYTIDRLKKDGSVPFLTTTNLALKKELFKKIGYFDSVFDLETGEDSDFCWRIFKAGERIRYQPSLRVKHDQRSTLLSFLKQHYKYGRGIFLVKKKHSDFMKDYKKSHLVRYLDELFVFPFVISKKFIKPAEKIAAFFLTLFRQAAFFAGIVLSKIKYD